MCRLILEGVLSLNEDKSLPDNWSNIYYIDENTLMFADRSSINLIDLRVKPDILTNFGIGTLTETCEVVTAAARGCINLNYIVTSHQTLCFDLRRFGFSQRWTHGIAHSPCLVSVHPENVENYNSVFVGSQRNDSVVFFENKLEGNKFLSSVHPFEVPSLRESLHLAHYNGYCLGSVSSARFKMSLTGIYSVNDKFGMTLFRHTSAGDIFVQRLTKSGSPSIDLVLSDNELKLLESWNELCERLYFEGNYPCVATEYHKESRTLREVRRHVLESSEINDAKIDTEKKRARKEPWQVSKSELKRYQDFLAPRILEAWNLDWIQEWGDEEEVYSDLDERTDEELEYVVAERVSKWLENYSEEKFSEENNPDNPDENPFEDLTI